MSIKRFAAGSLVVSTLGLAMITQHEGVVTDAYLDPVGIPTICMGHTEGVFLGQRRTLKECEVLLKQDVSYAGKAIARCTKVDMTRAQYDAATSFAFNVGGSAYCTSTLLRKFNAGDCWGAAKELNDEPQIDRRTGRPRIYAGRSIVDRTTGQVLLARGDTIKKWTTGGGVPLPGLIKRRAAERALFETGCERRAG